MDPLCSRKQNTHRGWHVLQRRADDRHLRRIRNSSGGLSLHHASGTTNVYPAEPIDRKTLWVTKEESVKAALHLSFRELCLSKVITHLSSSRVYQKHAHRKGMAAHRRSEKKYRDLLRERPRDHVESTRRSIADRR